MPLTLALALDQEAGFTMWLQPAPCLTQNAQAKKGIERQEKLLDENQLRGGQIRIPGRGIKRGKWDWKTPTLLGRSYRFIWSRPRCSSPLFRYRVY